MSDSDPDGIFPIGWLDDEPTFQCPQFNGDHDSDLGIQVNTSVDSHFIDTITRVFYRHHHKGLRGSEG